MSGVVSGPIPILPTMSIAKGFEGLGAQPR